MSMLQRVLAVSTAILVGALPASGLFAAVDSTDRPAPQATAVKVGRPALISFPDGSSITVHLTKFPVVAGGTFPTLKRRAEAGDAEAAFSLYKRLNTCKSAYADEKSLGAAINTLRTEHLLVYPKVASRTPISLPSDTNISGWETSLRESYESCLQFSAEEKQGADTWLRKAVEGGDMRAQQENALQLQLHKGLPPPWTAEAREAWESIWHMYGNHASLSALSVIYKDGSDQPPDPTLAYAYQLAANLLHTASGDLPSSLQQAEVDVLRRLSERLSPAEQQRAETIAKQLFEDNPNCCMVR